jgi:hypothetical protein
MSRAADLARRLAREAEAVCRYYLDHGRRQGRYWIVGDVANTPGRSLFVRLTGPDRGKGAAGKWTDAATGEHGDLLDLIALNRGFHLHEDLFDEARSFLRLPRSPPDHDRSPARAGSTEAARRLFEMAQPLAGTLAARYLRDRGITDLHGISALRFHPRCYYRNLRDGTRSAGPALIAAVTDRGRRITGVQRTWLAPSGHGKAAIETPRRAIGLLLGHGVRFGRAADVMVAGEGIETMLSVRMVLRDMPMIAALSANHLAAVALPCSLRRLYIARDNDPAGIRATGVLSERARAADVVALTLCPVLGDFNDDLRCLGIARFRASLARQLLPGDAQRFLSSAAGTER